MLNTLWEMFYPAGRYNLNFDISAFLLSLALLIMYLMKKDKAGMRSRIYYTVCILLMLASGNEVIVLAMRNDPSIFVFSTSYITNMVSHIAHNSLAYMFFVYLGSYIGAEHYISRKKTVLLSLPVIIMIVFMLVPPLQRLIYVIGADGSFMHGPLYPYFYAETLFYFICSIFVLLDWRRTLGNMTVFFLVVMLTGGMMMLVSTKWQYLKMNNFVLSLLGLLAFYVVEEEASSIDSDTGLLSFSSFTKDSRALFGHNYHASVITVKLLDPDYYLLTYGIENFQELRNEIGRWFSSFKKDDLFIYSIDKSIFSLIYYGNHKKEAEAAAEKIRKRFDQPWEIGSYQLVLNAEVWLGHVPEHFDSHEQLLLSVTAPASPDNQKDKVLIADALQRQQRRIAVSRAIARGIREHTFKVFYQPIYDTRDGKIHTAEALIRLTDPDIGPVSPEEFIKIAEQNGNINEIGMFVFRQVCRFYTENHLDQIGIDFIEVNLSTIQCMDVSLAQKLKEALAEYHLDVSHIDLEITESALIHNRAVMNETISKLKEIGFTFSLDDFGTGFSNYEYVITFPLSLIKIDKSILWAADKNAENERILAHTIQMCHDLNHGIVVEGVETAEQIDKLIKRKVEYLQGFYYSKPVEGSAFIDYVKKFNGI